MIKDKAKFSMYEVECFRTQDAHVYSSILQAKSNKGNFKIHQIIHKVQVDILIKDKAKFIMKEVECYITQDAHV